MKGNPHAPAGLLPTKSSVGEGGDIVEKPMKKLLAAASLLALTAGPVLAQQTPAQPGEKEGPARPGHKHAKPGETPAPAPSPDPTPTPSPSPTPTAPAPAGPPAE